MLVVFAGWVSFAAGIEELFPDVSKTRSALDGVAEAPRNTPGWAAKFPVSQAGSYTLVLEKGVGRSAYLRPNTTLILAGEANDRRHEDASDHLLYLWQSSSRPSSVEACSGTSLPALNTKTEPVSAFQLLVDQKSSLSYYSLEIPHRFVGGRVLMALDFDPETASPRRFPLLSDPFGHEVTFQRLRTVPQATVLANEAAGQEANNQDSQHHDEDEAHGQSDHSDHDHEGHDPDHDHDHDHSGHADQDHEHDHDHDHEDHDHEDHDHEDHDHEDHDHDHDHEDHDHDHDHEGHSHSDSHGHSHGAGKCGGHSHSHGHSHGSGEGTGEPPSAWVQVSKALAILAVLASALLGVLLRMKCPTLQSPAFFSYINVLSGGMFIAMGLFHILPESIEHQPCSMGTLFTEEVSAMAVVFFVFLGFMLVLFFERVLFDAHGNSHSHDDSVEEDVKNLLNARRSFIARAVDLMEPRSETSLEVAAELSQRRPSLSRAASGAERANAVQGGIEMQTGDGRTAAAAPPNEVAAVASHHHHGEDPGHDHHNGGRGGFGAILLMAALSVHSLFEGIVIGTAESASTVWLLAAIVVAHKWAAAFSVANQLSSDQRQNRLAQGLLAIFCLASPIGSILGWSINAMTEAAESEGPAFVQTLLNSIAVGTLFYIGFVEVIPEEFTGPKDAIKRFAILLLSALFVFWLTLLHLKHGHSHNH